MHINSLASSPFFFKYFPFSHTPYSFFIILQFIIFHLQLTSSHKYVKKHNSISISIFIPPFITQSQKNSNLLLKSNFNRTQKTTTNSFLALYLHGKGAHVRELRANLGKDIKGSWVAIEKGWLIFGLKANHEENQKSKWVLGNLDST